MIRHSIILLLFLFYCTIAAQDFVSTTVRLRDNINLAVDYFSISDEEGVRFPAIVELTPYGRRSPGVTFRHEATYWSGHGYVYVVADCRGTGDSTGTMEFLARDGKDGYDLIEWVAQQPWSNGQVGMRGFSYAGTLQWYIAKEQPPHLSCITPSESLGKPMEDTPYLSGAFAVNWALMWTKNFRPFSSSIQTPPNVTEWLKHRPLRTLDQYVLGRELPLYRTFLDHPTYDAYWKALDFQTEDFARIKVPSLAFTGWFDPTIAGTIWRFNGVQRYSVRSADHFLIVGPYTHFNAAEGGYDIVSGKPQLTIGDLTVSLEAMLPGKEMARNFFDWCLKNKSRPDWEATKMFVMESDKWMIGSTFPPSNTIERSLYLTSGGQTNENTLEWTSATTHSSNSYISDPTDPIFLDSSLDLPVDINAFLANNKEKMLIYTSQPLTESLTVVGDVIVELNMSSTARDTDFIAILMDVHPEDGRSIKLGSRAAGQIRARYRESFDREVLMTPGETYLLRIDLHAIGHTFRQGHRIRLAIMSTLFPWISANPNTGNAIATDMADPVVANQTIYQMASRVRFLVVSSVTSSVQPQFLTILFLFFPMYLYKISAYRR